MTFCRHTWLRLHTATVPHIPRRCSSALAWKNKLARRVQAYTSTTRDPHLNLSIEHDILSKSDKDSVVLFLYINRPSVIIGRNQNPWLEVNLPLLGGVGESPTTEPPGLGTVDLVRRRSGGGTVFHDEGNVNWTVICPKDQFTRDKHAEMVTRALRACGIHRARVNERHDIVLDQGSRGEEPDANNTHVTAFTSNDPDSPRSLKVSGSAYKITGSHRALHHGTCLLSSPNLNIIPDYLHSPMKPFITEARGVQSVSSPVGNILLSNEDFSGAVFEQFSNMYLDDPGLDFENLGEEMLDLESVATGRRELKSSKYKYESTPRFTLSNASDLSAAITLELQLQEGRLGHGSVASRLARSQDPYTFEITEETHRMIMQQMVQTDRSERQKMATWSDVLAPLRQHVEEAHFDHLIAWLQEITSLR